MKYKSKRRLFGHKPRIRLTAAMLAAALLAGLTPVQALADDGNTGEAAQLAPESALWQPEREESVVLNTEGDLSFAELQQRTLPAADLPEVLSAAEAAENGHVHRLRAQEEDLNTVVFQNRDGTKTMYQYARPVKYMDSAGMVRDKKNTLTPRSGKRPMHPTMPMSTAKTMSGRISRTI